MTPEQKRKEDLVCFKDTYPLPRWHWLLNKEYFSYTKKLSDEMEKAYQNYTINKGTATFSVGLINVDFVKMKSVSTASAANQKEKTLVRGTWFYISDEGKGTYMPYEYEVSITLEAALQSGTFGHIEVSHSPLRVVMYEGNNSFKQYRFSKNANKDGRVVHRGWGHTFIRDGVEYNYLATTKLIPSVSSPRDAPGQSNVIELVSKGITSFPSDDIDRKFPAIARGSYGIVYTGKVVGIPYVVVIKDMYIRDQRSIDEWTAEITTMSTSQSPYVAKVFGFSIMETVVTIIMEYMEKGDLFSAIHTKKMPISILRRILMTRQVTSGLEILHKNNILHRDIKSMNILITNDFDCKLTDFGMSKLITEDQEIINTANAGTPLWMAPEVRLGRYGYPADVYSLGLVIYELLELRLPEWDKDKCCVKLPSTYKSDTVVAPCLHEQPQKRPTPSQLIQNIDDFLVIPCINHLRKLYPTQSNNITTQQEPSLQLQNWIKNLEKDNTDIDKVVTPVRFVKDSPRNPPLSSDTVLMEARPVPIKISKGTLAPTETMKGNRHLSVSTPINKMNIKERGEGHINPGSNG